MHRYHPDAARGDNTNAVLFDDCGDCAERARSLGLGLDGHNFSAIWRRMIDVEYRFHGAYLSETEAALGSALFKITLLIQRNPFVADPIPEGQVRWDG